MKNRIIGIVLIALGIGLFKAQPKIDEFLKPFGRTPFVLVLRDIYIATVAHNNAGDDIPFEVVYNYYEMDWNKIDYTRCSSLKHSTWGIKTNSMWLADKVRMIVPFYYYENIREAPRYPRMALFYPYIENKSFHILGSSSDRGNVVAINERFILEKDRRDLRRVYSTIVHEMIHQQQAGFIVDFIRNIELPSNLEARTQAATVEVLAAMCHYGDEVACKAFWSEIEGYARGSLLMRLRMYGHEDWYDVIANLLWRDAEDELARDKSLRHWMSDAALKAHYYSIINKYQKMPWEDIVVEGICGKGLRTGFLVEAEGHTEEHPLYKMQLMKFDDTQSMLGSNLVNMICRMPHGPEVH